MTLFLWSVGYLVIGYLVGLVDLLWFDEEPTEAILAIFLWPLIPILWSYVAIADHHATRARRRRVAPPSGDHPS